MNKPLKISTMLFICSTLISVLNEGMHFVFFQSQLHWNFVLNFYLGGLFFSIIFALILLKLKKLEIFRLNYILGLYSFYFSIPVFIFLLVLFYFPDEMNRYIYWFWPGLIFSTSYIFFQDKYK